MKERWLKIDKKAGLITKLVTEVTDTVQVQMVFVRENAEDMDEDVLKAGEGSPAFKFADIKPLKSRGLIERVQTVSYVVTAGRVKTPALKQTVRMCGGRYVGDSIDGVRRNASAFDGRTNRSRY